MTQPSSAPAGTTSVGGVTHHRSRHPVNQTTEKLLSAIEAAGAKVFAVIDQTAEARRVGLDLRPTQLVLFGSPVAGTPIMKAAPVAALDLPLKILVWEDDSGEVWMTHLGADWLAARYDLPPDLAKPLRAPSALATKVSAS